MPSLVFYTLGLTIIIPPLTYSNSSRCAAVIRHSDQCGYLHFNVSGYLVTERDASAGSGGALRDHISFGHRQRQHCVCVCGGRGVYTVYSHPLLRVSTVSMYILRNC